MMLALALAAAAAAPAGLPAVEASIPNPRAIELFDREPPLKAWALKTYDSNHDGWLTSFEAQTAADAFRTLADNDGDGHVTMTEYRAALAFIAARY